MNGTLISRRNLEKSLINFFANKLLSTNRHDVTPFSIIMKTSTCCSFFRWTKEHKKVD